MPRPKPPEELLPFHVRLTRKQIRKVKTLGVEWLRRVISRAKPRYERTTLEAYAMLSARDRAIAESDEPTSVLAARYTLSTGRIRQIRRKHRS